MTSTLTYAKYYIGRGWYVFPVRAYSKEPAVKWRDEASIDPDKITAWFADGEYNIGLVCGAQSGIVVLDVDKGHGGDESLMALIVEHGKLPATPESLTGGGGRHILFTHPGIEIRNSASKLAPGLDIRGDGGYIVAPPSIHPSRQKYLWEESSKPSQVPLAKMPDWMIDELREQQHQSDPVQVAITASDAIQDGGRNQALTSLAGTMRRRGMYDDEIFMALSQVNQNRCKPPLSNDEIMQISKSVGRYAPTAPPQVSHPTVPTVRDPLDAFAGVSAFIDLLEHLDGRIIPTFISPVDRCIGGVERQTLTILAGRPGMGKSTIAWQIARNDAAAKMKVLFFSLEMSIASLWAKAACGACGISWTDVKAGRVSPDKLDQIIDVATRMADNYGHNLLIDDGTNTTDTIREMAERVRPDLIVVDHLRLVSDRHDSEVQRLGIVTQKLKDLAKGLNCGVITLAQLNRGVEDRDSKVPQLSDLRDSGQIEENADLVLMIYRPDYYNPKPKDDPTRGASDTWLYVRKFRDGDPGSGIEMTFDSTQQEFRGKHELHI